MKPLSLDFSRLEKALLQSNSPLLKILGTGLIEFEIESRFKEIGLAFPKDLLQLYMWKNGIDKSKVELYPQIDPSLFMLGRFYSLDENLEYYRYYVTSNYWSKNLFPIFSAGNSEFFLINCDEQSAEEFGKLYYYSTTDYLALEPITVFDSLKNLIQDITECYRKGIFVYDSENNNLIVTSSEGEIKIHLANNPESAYWTKL